jgi:hypothetical protein
VAKPPYAPAARKCAEQVIAGDVPDCRWVKLACQRKFNYLARLRSKATPFRFNTKLTERDGRSYYPAVPYAPSLTVCVTRRARWLMSPLSRQTKLTQSSSIFRCSYLQHSRSNTLTSEANRTSVPILHQLKDHPCGGFLVGGFQCYQPASTRGSITPCH